MFFYFGIHKAASTWLINILYDISNHMYINHKHYHSKKILDYDINDTIDKQQLDFLSYTNADYQTVLEIIKPYKAFHVIRDPRDIIVSSYFSHLNSHSDYMWPEINEYRKELKSLNIEEGVLATIRHLECMYIDSEPVKIFDCLNDWDYENPNIKEVRFEDITKQPYIVLPEIFDFLGLLNKAQKELPITKRVFDKIIKRPKDKIQLNNLLYYTYKNDFYFKTKGRKKGDSNEGSHYRKGLSGDWVNFLTKKHKDIVKEKLGDLIIKLDYEKDNNW